jgi:hypothetical protein
MIIAGGETEEGRVKPIAVSLCTSWIPCGLVWDQIGTARNIFNVIICSVIFSTMFSFYFKQCKIIGGDLCRVR